MSILVVDDEKEIADLVEVILKNEGYEVRKFYDSRLAFLETEANSSIDLAILDVMMPGMDGFTLCSKIRENTAGPCSATECCVSAKCCSLPTGPVGCIRCCNGRARPLSNW